MEIGDLKNMMGDQMEDALLGYFSIKKILEIKSMLRNNQDDYFINCLVCGNTDVDLHSLSFTDLDFMSKLQHLNEQLISKGLDTQDRNKELKDFAEVYSTILI